jgi:hypothetical protein
LSFSQSQPAPLRPHRQLRDAVLLFKLIYALVLQ